MLVQAAAVALGTYFHSSDMWFLCCLCFLFNLFSIALFLNASQPGLSPSKTRRCHFLVFSLVLSFSKRSTIALFLGSSTWVLSLSLNSSCSHHLQSYHPVAQEGLPTYAKQGGAWSVPGRGTWWEIYVAARRGLHEASWGQCWLLFLTESS